MAVGWRPRPAGPRSCRRLLAVMIATGLAAGAGGAVAGADEAAVADRTITEAAERPGGTFARAFEEILPGRVPLPRLRAFLESQPPFLRDTELTLHARTYWLRADEPDESDREAWTAGGWLRYRSGWLRDTVQLGATLYTSQPLYAPDDRDGTGLLAPGQDGYTVLGEARAVLRYGEHRLTGYRQLLDLPYVNRQDSLMTPNTFEGVTLLGQGPRLGYAAGYLTAMKKRNAGEFADMARAAGASAGGRGLLFAGARVEPWKGFWVGAIDHLVDDVLNIAYVEVEHVWTLEADLRLRIGAQFTDQRSVGDHLLTGAPFDTQVGGARVSVTWAGLTLTAAFSMTAGGADVRNPFGSYPGYLSLIRTNFNRADEDAWLLGAAYDFSRAGLDGLSAFVNAAVGTGAREPATGRGRPDVQEYDVTVDYRPRGQWGEGWWLRVRGALVREGGRTAEEVRLILNYDFPVL